MGLSGRLLRPAASILCVACYPTKSTPKSTRNAGYSGLAALEGATACDSGPPVRQTGLAGPDTAPDGKTHQRGPLAI